MAKARVAPREGAAFARTYHKYFEVVPADTPELLERVFRLRYDVYCLEKPYEDAAENPGGREVDAYDRRAVHSLLIHRTSGEVAGTVRLILGAGAGDPELPIQTACPELANWPEGQLPGATTAEISRFTVARRFRQRISDTIYADTGVRWPASDEFDGRRALPHITLGLLTAVGRMSKQNGITHWCAIMEPALLRLLARLGVYFSPIGSLVEYHGWRQPCSAVLSQVDQSIMKKQPKIHKLVAE